MLRTPTKFNLSASRLNNSQSRMNMSMSKIHEEPAAATKRGSSYGIVLTSPKGTTSLRGIPEGASLPEMAAAQKDGKTPSFNITISKIFGRGATRPNVHGGDQTLDTSLGYIPQNRTSRIFGTSAKKYNPEDDLFSNSFREQPGFNYSQGMIHHNRSHMQEVRGARHDSLLDTSVSRGYMNNSYTMRSRKSIARGPLFSKLLPKYLEEDRTQLEDETLDESVKGSKKVKVVLPNNRILDDSIIMDIEGKNIDKTPKFEVSEIKEDSRFHNVNNNTGNPNDSKYVLKIFF